MSFSYKKKPTESEDPMEIAEPNSSEKLKRLCNRMEELSKELYKCSRLADKKLVDDEVNLYMELLNKKYGDSGRRKFMDTFFFASLINRQAQNADKTKATRFIRKLFNSDGTLPDIVVIPVHVLNVHWGLLVIIFGTRHILAVDSYDSHEIITKKRDTTFSAELRKNFRLILQLFRKWNGKFCFNHIFKSTIPWIFYRGIHLEPQSDNDTSSCGYIMLLAARVIAGAKNITDMCAFNIKDIQNLKPIVESELKNETLLQELDELSCVSVQGIEKTKSFRVYYTRAEENLPIWLDCQLNPMYIAYKTLSRYFTKTQLTEDEYNAYKTLLMSTQTGGRLLILLDCLDGDIGTVIERISTCFNTLTKERTLITQLDLDEILVIVHSSFTYSVISERVPTLALELDWKLNKLEGEESTLDTNESGIIYDTLSCLYHSLVKQCRRLYFTVTSTQLSKENALRSFKHKSHSRYTF